jgi:putative ABC transport system substrate-binding protein
MTRRSWVTLTVLVCLAAAYLSGCGSTAKKGEKSVGIALLAPISLLQDNVNQFKSELAASGFKDGRNVTFSTFNAEDQLSNVNSIVTRLVQLHPSLVYLVGTPLVEGFVEQRTNIPVLFGAMTNPVAGKVVKTLAHPGGEVTGTSDAVPATVTLGIVKRTLPSVTRVGIIGNPSEPNSVSQISAIQAAAKPAGIQVIYRSVPSTSEVASAIRSLGSVGALIIPSDSTVVGALGGVVQTARQLHIPTFSTAGGSLAAQGIMMSFGVDYQTLGREAGVQAAKILHGASPASMPVVGLASGAPLQLGVNLATARALGVGIPAAMRKQATAVYGGKA